MSPADPAPRPRTGYVLKMYPRFSETFVVNEILGREARGEDLEIFSLRPPADPRFHAQLADVRAPVRYIDRPHTVPGLWERLTRALSVLPDLGDHLPALFAVPPDQAAQAVDLAVAVRRGGITHLHAHFASLAADIAALAATLTGIGFSVTAHAKDLFHESVSTDHLADLFAAATHVVTISEHNVRWIGEHVGTGRVHRIHNGLDLTRFPFAAEPDPTVPPRIVAVGRLVEKKGFDVLLRALARLRDEGVLLDLDLIGSGEREASLRELVDGLGLHDRVTLHGPQPQDRVVHLVRGATLLACPCVVGADGNTDGMPTVLLEAMALGVPCISTDLSGIGEIVRDGATGLLVPPGDVAALAAAIHRMVGDPDLRRRCARAARRLIEAGFDVRHQAERLAAAQHHPTSPPGAVGAPPRQDSPV